MLWRRPCMNHSAEMFHHGQAMMILSLTPMTADGAYLSGPPVIRYVGGLHRSSAACFGQISVNMVAALAVPAGDPTRASVSAHHVDRLRRNSSIGPRLQL